LPGPRVDPDAIARPEREHLRPGVVGQAQRQDAHADEIRPVAHGENHKVPESDLARRIRRSRRCVSLPVGRFARGQAATSA
jgi:hypothetical protein